MYQNHYEFNKAETIEDKINVLMDFRILSSRHSKRANMVRKVLNNCTSEINMENVLHDVLIGNKSLNDLLTERGMLN